MYSFYYILFVTDSYQTVKSTKIKLYRHKKYNQIQDNLYYDNWGRVFILFNSCVIIARVVLPNVVPAIQQKQKRNHIKVSGVAL
jgi:hypothetical protein